MKKCFSMFLCLCMLLTMIPVFATTTDDMGASVCKVLFEEDFEGESCSITMTDTSAAVGAVTAIGETDEYGQGEKNYVVTNANASPYGVIFFDTTKKLTKSLRGGAHTESSETYGYTVEVSADWNPNDYNASNPYNRLGILSRETKEEGYTTGQLMFLNYVGGDDETSGRKIQLMDSGQSVVEEIDLTKVLGDEIWDTTHVYRVRFVIKPYTEKKAVTVNGTSKTYSGSIDAYVDDVKICTFEYLDGTKYTHVCGFYYRTNKVNASTLDNIKIIEYYDSLNSETEGAVSYINDDELVTTIRRLENVLPNLAEDKQATLSSAIASAKAVFEKADRTQESIDAATIALKEAEEEVNKVYQYTMLYLEGYENATYNPFGSYSVYNTETEDTENKSVVAATDSATDTYYAIDGKWYQLQTDNKYGLVQQFTAASEALRDNENNIENNYKVEVSFDYKMPGDISTSILINTKYSSTFNKGGKICILNINPKTGVAKFYDRDDIEIATINLSDYTAGADFKKEVNRFRFVFEPETEEDSGRVNAKGETIYYAGTITLYINGIKACDGKYVKNSKEQYIAGMTVKSGTDNAGKPLGYIDNIEMIDYDDVTCAVENAIPYVNKDKLVAAIRGAASVKALAVQEGIELPAEIDSLTAAAKSAYVSETATTASMNEAASALENCLVDVGKAIYSYQLVSDFAWIPNVAAESDREKAQNNIYGDLYLPSNYLAGTRDLDITWESDKPGVVDASGYVIRPMVSTYVNLKAIFTDGTDNDIYVEKNFKVRVLPDGDVIFNQVVENADETPQKNFAPTGKKFMLTVTGKAGEYTFTLGGQNITYTFAADGEYDVIYDTKNNTYTVYENCVLVETGAVTLGAVKTAKVSGKEITRFIGIDLNEDKAFISAYSYNKGTYDLGVPTPGNKLNGVTLKIRDDVENAILVAAVYSNGIVCDADSVKITAAAGETVNAEFADGVELPEGETFENATLKVFLWNEALTPIMTPVIYSKLGDQYEERATVYMIGDSTMCNYSASYYPRAGWGEMLGNYFDETQVVVDNRAVSGRTTKWFKEKGEFDKILSTIKPGDYLIMQFGHNDQKPANNISLADYKANLEYFAKSVQAKGAVPVICSSISRRYYNVETGLYDPSIGSLGDYPAAALEVATSLNITGVDLYGYSKTELGKLTNETSKQLYCFVPNDYPGYDSSKLVKYVDGVEDNTHFSEYGADFWAKEAARIIALSGLSISSYVKNID